ncbi:MAG: primosomal protein N' [Eubacteriales bacterium]|nr:primosomal protein N' [Eubacteriales bacterium]
MKYVDLVIDNKSNHTDQLYTYGCFDDEICIGQKVFVQFAKGRKLRAAYVFAVHTKLQKEFKNLKYVSETDPSVCLTEEMIRTCQWMQRRYLCRLIDAVHLFTPAGDSPKRARKQPVPDGIERETALPALTAEQQQVLSEMASKQRQGKRLFLLHGVTGSGKTEVYMRLIARCLQEGRTAIMLVPEISLTKQIVERFAARFSETKMAVLHSSLSPGQRYDTWQRIRGGEVRIVIGARSAVFAPLSDIGLIILDEEHEATYKSDMTPKYDTCEVAIKRAGAFDGSVLCGSATPSVATYQRSEWGIFTRLTMKKRYNEMPLPEVEVVDMGKELARGNTSVFSERLVAEMRRQLEEGRQVILLMNRRGYYTYITCPSCGEVITCPTCGISLTYHKSTGKCSCHYCGRSFDVPAQCPSCGAHPLQFSGSGTEKVAETAQRLFEEYPVARLDMDTMRRKGALTRILDDFAAGRTRILAGTQVVAKGLDFPNVGLVGVVSADVSLHIPDYRSPERTFQLVTQAAGRAGRGSVAGRVIVQSRHPEHYAVAAAVHQDYPAFFRQEIEVRRLLVYPPYADLIQLVFTAREERAAAETARLWEGGLRRLMGESERPYILHYQKMEIFAEKDIVKYYMVVKCRKGMRKYYMGALKKLKTDAIGSRDCSVVVDINPYSLGRS